MVFFNMRKIKEFQVSSFRFQDKKLLQKESTVFPVAQFNPSGFQDITIVSPSKILRLSIRFQRQDKVVFYLKHET